MMDWTKIKKYILISIVEIPYAMYTSYFRSKLVHISLDGIRFQWNHFGTPRIYHKSVMKWTTNLSNPNQFWKLWNITLNIHINHKKLTSKHSNLQYNIRCLLSNLVITDLYKSTLIYKNQHRWFIKVNFDISKSMC